MNKRTLTPIAHICAATCTSLLLATPGLAAPPAHEGSAAEGGPPGDDDDWGGDDGDGGDSGDSGFAMEDVEGDGDGDGDGDWSDVEEETLTPTVAPDTSGDGDGDGDGDDGWDDAGGDGDEGFTFEDISEDPEALQEIMQGEDKQAKGPGGVIKGRVVGSDGQPIFGAIVEVVGKVYVTSADAQGNYELRLKPGKYEIRIRADEYEAVRFPGTEIQIDGIVEIDTSLKPLGELEVVKVEAEINKEGEAGRLIERKKDVVARDIISSEEISKSGGGAASSAAARVVGATVVGGKYVFVRGLGHRYGNTLMDGARVPSPDPNRRSVPLDIFPSGALSAINIQKTLSPDVPGDFAGGSVQLETKGIPEDPVIKLGIEMGINSRTTFVPYLQGNQSYAADAFAFGNRPRALSSIIPSDRKVDRQETDENFDPLWTPEQIEDFGEAFQTDGTIRNRGAAPPNYGMKLTLGNGWETRKAGRFGLLMASGYKNKWQTHRGLQRRVFGLGSDGELQTKTAFDERATQHQVAWNTLGLGRWDISDDQRLDATVFYAREGEDEQRTLEGEANAVIDQGNVRTLRSKYEMRSTLLGRLGGRHRWDLGTPGKAGHVEDFQLDWFASLSQARMDSPGLREMVFTDADSDGSFNIDIANGAGNQLFQNLIDNQQNGAFDITVPFKQWSGLESEFKVGGWAEAKQREFGARRFAYKLSSGYGLDDVDATDPGFINPENIGNGRANGIDGTGPLQIFEGTRPQDNYRGRQQIYATYGKLTLPFAWWFKVSGGARLEVNQMRVEPFDLFGEDDQSELQAKLDDVDVLPSASFIFSPRREKQDMNFRLTGAKSLARPEFRELAPFAFKDFAGGVDVVGRADLQTTRIWNVDARWEWFPEASDVVAASVFYKHFIDPIEVVRLAGADIQTYQNADLARLVGFELEARKNLGFMTRGRERRGKLSWLRDVSIGANFAYTASRVELAECDASQDPDCQADVSTTNVRPLQGLSPWVANAYLDYSNSDSGTDARLLYNAKAGVLSALGRNGLPNIFTTPLHQLDLTFSQRVYAQQGAEDEEGESRLRHELRWNLGFENLLNAQVYQTAGSERWRTKYDGMTVTSGLSWSY